MSGTEEESSIKSRSTVAVSLTERGFISRVQYQSISIYLLGLSGG